MVGEGQEGAPGAGDPAVPPQAQDKATQVSDSLSPAHGRSLQGSGLAFQGEWGQANRQEPLFSIHVLFLLVPPDYFEVNLVDFRCLGSQHLELRPHLAVVNF